MLIQIQKMKPKIKIQYSKEKVFPVDQDHFTVGIHGIEGSFTNESVVLLTEQLGVDLDRINFEYLVEGKKVMEAVNEGKIDRGVFCVANSGSGAYIESMFAMGLYKFEVLVVYGMEILQCLMSHPSVKNIGEIKEVFGHPQAISQCKRTFKEKYPDIKLIPGKDKDDTALCAKKISEGDLSSTTATLASQMAAELYGLNILEYGMHHDPYNTTSFVLVKKKIV